MKSARKLRAVPDCPQPETPYKPVQYGMAPWPKLPPTPTADQLTIRCRVQSMRSVGGKRAELMSYEDSLAWLRAQEPNNRRFNATVPQPLPASPDIPSREGLVGNSSIKTGVSP